MSTPRQFREPTLMLEPETPVDSRQHLPPEGPVSPSPEKATAEPSCVVQAETDPLTPAELSPQPSRRERFAWYAGTVLLSCILVFWGLRLDAADLKAPFYYDLDSLLILPMVKATVERGFGGHWQNERMGAPGILELYDFPVIDHLHFFLIWLLSYAVPNLLVLYNLYFLLTFPLTVLTTMITFRQLGMTLMAAAVGGLLYAFLPFHYQRWENHYFLAAYWMIPLSLLPAFAVTRGNFPFHRRNPDGTQSVRLMSWRSVGSVFLALLTSAAGAYYAFFTCALTAFAGLYASVAFRTFRGLGSAGVFCALIVAFGIVNHIPTYLFQAKYGKHPVTDRFPEEVDYYGLKIAHLVLPIEDHNLRVFNDLKALYNSPTRPSETENRSASLGVVGILGLLGMVCVVVLPVPRPWPYGPLIGMTVFTIFLSTIGGFGAIFNLLVTPQIRAYNRISVFIAFLCIFAFLWAFDKLWATHAKGLPARYLLGFAVVLLAVATMAAGLLDTGMKLLLLSLCALCWVAPVVAYAIFRYRSPEALKRAVERYRHRLLPTWVRYAAWASVALVGFLDQTPFSWFRTGIVTMMDEHASRFRADSQFFQRIEQQMPAGSKIFCLPYCPFPETPPIHRMPAYEHARGYCHTSGLNWSFGAMKGRESDEWQQSVAAQPVDEFLRRIVLRGFDGLMVDKRGYATTKKAEANPATTLIGEIHKYYANLAGNPKLKLPEIIHSDGEQVFLDLRPCAEVMRQKYRIPPHDFETYARQERELPSLIWLAGFQSDLHEFKDLQLIRQGAPKGTAWFINPTDRTRTFTVSLVFGTENPGTFHLKMSGLLNDEVDIDRQSPEWVKEQFGIPRSYQVEVPPGRHRINFVCSLPDSFVAGDIRKLCYYVTNVRVSEP